VAQTPQGRYLICNPMETVQRSLLAAGAFEPAAHRIAEVFARETQGLVVDVGANLGAFSVPLANRMPEQRILAVEPQAMVFMNLCANLLLNKARKVKPVNLAIGSGGGQIRVPRFDVFSERFTGSVSLDQDVVKVRGAIQGVAEPQGWATEFDHVALRSLDELVGNELVSFIKIDVEGMELEVLKSAPHILASSQPVIFFEAWSLDEFKTQVDHLLTFVAAQGYEVIRIGSDCLAYPPARFSPEQVKLLLLQAGVAPG
jgi:FkbM family methyltransferase